MNIFKSDRGIGYFVALTLMAVIVSATSTQITNNLQVAVVAAIALVLVGVGIHECAHRLQQSSSLAVRAVLAGLLGVLFYGGYLVFQFNKDLPVQWTPSLGLWVFLTLLAIVAIWLPRGWKPRKRQQ